MAVTRTLDDPPVPLEYLAHVAIKRVHRDPRPERTVSDSTAPLRAIFSDERFLLSELCAMSKSLMSTRTLVRSTDASGLSRDARTPRIAQSFPAEAGRAAADR